MAGGRYPKAPADDFSRAVRQPAAAGPTIPSTGDPRQREASRRRGGGGALLAEGSGEEDDIAFLSALQRSRKERSRLADFPSLSI